MQMKHIGLPPEERLAAKGGLMDSLEYRDLRHLGWQDFEAVYGEEEELLARVAAGDDLYDDTFAYETLSLGLEPGVASAVVALAAIGCPPLTSCAGGEGHRESHPLVVFWCSSAQLDALSEAARAAGVGLKGCLEPGIMVYAEAGQWDLMRAFAVNLARLRSAPAMPAG